VIVLTDGQKQVWLDTRRPLELETDNPELEAELLKGIQGLFSPYSSQEMRSVGRRVIKGNQLISRPAFCVPPVQLLDSALRRPVSAFLFSKIQQLLVVWGCMFGVRRRVRWPDEIWNRDCRNPIQTSEDRLT
jgi:hypothetical protein